jgi:alkylation response protein AidB-like acyl-CoA dehydrogenase
MNKTPVQIDHPDSPALVQLCHELASRAGSLRGPQDWPRWQLNRCAAYGVFKWFVPPEYGGTGWDSRQIAAGYVRLAAACLTTTFVVTQWAAAVKRILLSDEDAFEPLRRHLLEDLLSGQSHITVGISHLTTSRRHLNRPALLATCDSQGGYCLAGVSPWVTASSFADHFLIGAALSDGNEVLLVVPAAQPGIRIEPSHQLVALSASCTGAVHFQDVGVPPTHLVAGPSPSVLSSKGSAGTGGLQTSALALGLSRAAVDFMADQASRRPDLVEKSENLETQWQSTCEYLYSMAEGRPVCSSEELRTQANSLVLRTTQAALVAAKGAGFVEGHPVGRWCREALFFLVWSCPQTVQDANLCELAGIR